LGFLSSSREGKRRRVRNAPRARIRKMRIRCTGVRFGNNASPFYHMSAQIILSNRPNPQVGGLSFSGKSCFSTMLCY
jgi:hypothetical protein